jgi:5,10-methenyltetrahydrofolate synthetase
MIDLPLRQQKQALRQRMRLLRDATTPEQRAAWSAAICARVLASPAYRQARVIHCYLPIRSEVDPRAIIEDALAHGKRVAIPLWQAHSDETPACEIDTLAEDAFTVDAMGLRTPRRLVLLPPDEIDLVLVPLLAFAPCALERLANEGEDEPTSPPSAVPSAPPRTGEGRYVTQTSDATAPSPGTPGEGWGGGYMRLGYGAGFYDRFLRRTRARRVGLAFALQQVDWLPQAETDALLDDVITER